MTGRELKALRLRSGMSLTEFARAMGYEGQDDNENRRIRRLEATPVLPKTVALRAAAVQLEVAVADMRRWRAAIGRR